MTDDKLLTVREVARRCGRSEETVRRWIWSGKLPARKIGNQLFIEEDDIATLTFLLGVSERRVAYGVSRTRKQPALPTWPEYDRQEALRQAEDDFRFGQRLQEKYGRVDVSELIRQVREEDD